ncbi:MAG: ACP S-malonyltransferase, partial [bacterium]
EKLMTDGPPEELEQTEITQPAVFLANHIFYRYLTGAGVTAEYFAGHSLGEYNALVAGERSTFEDLLHVVLQRGKAMAEAAGQVDGGMAAVLKMDPDPLRELCEEVSSDDSIDGTVEVALFNSPGQIVVSGSSQAIDAVVDRAKEQGALKAVPLDVSGPWHSQYMQPAENPLSDALKSVDWNLSGPPVITNVTADPLDGSPNENLVQQLTQPVQWIASIEYLLDEGVDEFVEVGPGDALEGMINRIVRGTDHDPDVYTTDTLEETKSVVEELKQ